MTDEAFAISIKRFETTDRPELAHYHLLGSGLTLWVCWQIATVVGVLAGATIPDELNLGFAIPLTFMALVLPNLRRLSDIAAATSAALVALFGQALPWNAWIVADGRGWNMRGWYSVPLGGSRMIWIVMILTGLANFAVRFSMFSGLRASTLPDWAERYLRYVPTAVLSAIIAAALFLDEAGDIQMWNTTVLAGLIAAIIAILTRSVIFTIITGLGVLWIIG